MDIKNIDIEKITRAAELDAGHAIPGLREGLMEAKRGEDAAVHTPAQIMARRAGRPTGSRKAAPKVSTTIRLSPDVVSAFRAAGDGWQTRIDAALKDWLRTHSPV